MKRTAIACRWPVLALVLSGALSCSRVERADIVGTWVMTDASRRRLPTDAQKARTELVLQADGSFVATDLPGLFSSEERDAGKLVSGTGVWKLEARGGQQLQLDFLTHKEPTNPTPIVTLLRVSGGTLFYFVGDPDDG